MKRIIWFATVAALLVGCSGFATAQCAGNANPGGYDLLSTFSGTQDDLSSIGLGVVSFTGVPLPGGLAGNADTIVCRIDALPNPIPAAGAPLNIQVVALLLKGDTQYTNRQGITQNVTVYATINQTQDAMVPPNYTIPLGQLPQPDQLPTASTGTMTVFSNGTFNTDLLNIQADLIVVPRGQPVTATPIFTRPMPSDTMSSNGSTWTTTPPAGYPDSSTFTAGGFYVNEPGAGGGLGAALITSPIVRGSLYGLGLLLVGIAVLKIRSSASSGRLTLRPIYLVGLAAIAWFVAWRSSKLVFPTIVHAQGVITTCVPHTISAWVHEGGGHFVLHKIVSAVCTTISATTTSSLQ
jgi:hypothetical protein